MLSDLFHDGISASGHDTGSINSSGVQMIGDTSPARRQASIFPRMAALARCRRFQVTRKSTPLTAAIATCAASTRALDGKAPLRRSERMSAPARGPAAKIGTPQKRVDASGGRERVAAPRFCHHSCRDEQIKPGSRRPPLACHLLVSRLDQILRGLRDQIADDCRFEVDARLPPLMPILPAPGVVRRFVGPTSAISGRLRRSAALRGWTKSACGG